MNQITYHHSVPPFLRELSEAPAMKRLGSVGMNCGCEYTALPRFRSCAPYSRLEHCLGVALIIWHFTESPCEAISGLFHDISTPAFSHVVDFLQHDHLRQESTEEPTRRFIADSPEIQGVLSRLSLTTDDVCDYHRFPIADNNSPRLSSDRLEYTCSNMLGYGFAAPSQVQAMYDDLVVAGNPEGQPELSFRHKETALAFAEGALACSKVYVCREDRYAMESLAHLLSDAISGGVLTMEELWQTEPAVIHRLLENPGTKAAWLKYRSLQAVTAHRDFLPGRLQVFAKKRYIDPFVVGSGRVTELFPDFRQKLEEFLSSSQKDYLEGHYHLQPS